ncbi:basic proline-rich protein-like [Phacochoerus africanus]|uniref:basic proline-rich protein-like n=1 Tax=Phacochoerus africanus TaxID=41426 RepID=UPI001FDAA401|nr:basic proline-rich protein-like [Phacochoerus africanus]
MVSAWLECPPGRGLPWQELQLTSEPELGLGGEAGPGPGAEDQVGQSRRGLGRGAPNDRQSPASVSPPTQWVRAWPGGAPARPGSRGRPRSSTFRPLPISALRPWPGPWPALPVSAPLPSRGRRQQRRAAGAGDSAPRCLPPTAPSPSPSRSSAPAPRPPLRLRVSRSPRGERGRHSRWGTAARVLAPSSCPPCLPGPSAAPPPRGVPESGRPVCVSGSPSGRESSAWLEGFQTRSQGFLEPTETQHCSRHGAIGGSRS